LRRLRLTQNVMKYFAGRTTSLGKLTSGQSISVTHGRFNCIR